MEKAMYAILGSVASRFVLVLLGCVVSLTNAHAASGTTTVERHRVQHRSTSADVRMIDVSTRQPAGNARSGTSEGSRSDDAQAVRLDSVALLSNTAPYGATFFAADGPAAEELQSLPAHAKSGYGLPLPEPDGWTAVLATVALGLFFFLRRIV
jgi:hypothetical protein